MKRVMVRSYDVYYERDRSEDVWLVDVPDIDGCHTYGRTLAKARANALEAIAVCVDVDPEAVVTRDHFDLGAEPEAALRNLDKAREALSDAQRAYLAESRHAAHALRDSGLSLRDAGEVMGLSFQRVQQLLG